MEERLGWEGKEFVVSFEELGGELGVAVAAVHCLQYLVS